MKINIGSTVAVLLMWAVMLVTLPFATTGCTSSQVVSEVNTVLTEASNVLVVAEPNAPWVPQLQAAITALKTSEASWTSGGAVQDVINALNTVEAITAVIPMTAAYSPLIDVLVAGVEAVLAALPPSTSTAAVKAVYNPHVGQVKLSGKSAKAFTAQWNATAAAHGLVGATIQ